ncbi:hypothetical protein D3C84_1038890 [compost metagenome]
MAYTEKMIASDIGIISPLAMPCTTRAAITSAMELASAPSNEPQTNSATPHR